MGLLGLVLIVLVGLLVLRNAVFTYPIAEQLVVANGDSGNCSKGKCSVIVSTLVDGGPGNPCRLSCLLSATDASGRSGQTGVTCSSSG